MGKGIIRASVTIPEDVYAKSKRIAGNFSSLVTEALKEYLKKMDIQKAKKSFGSWKGREEDSARIVNRMRAERERRYASRAD